MYSWILAIFFGLTSLIPMNAQAQAPNEKIIIGTKVSPPFVMKDDQGDWYGISIDLWRRLAEDLKRPYEIRELPLSEIFEKVASGEIHVGAGALSVTAQREKTMEFTHAVYNSGYAIALQTKDQSLIMSLLSGLFSIEFLTAILALISVLLIAGTGLWFFERKKNPDQFGGGTIQGLGHGLWWSAVTMTTVGYGDKAPVTIGGRVIAGVWMFASIIIISGFTATIAASLTLKNQPFDVSRISDLRTFDVATLEGSTSEEILKRENIKNIVFVRNVKEGLEAVQRGKVKAMVFDEPILRYYLQDKKFAEDIRIIRSEVFKQRYAFALPTNSPLREALNIGILNVTESDFWMKTLDTYLPTDKNFD